MAEAGSGDAAGPRQVQYPHHRHVVADDVDISSDTKRARRSDPSHRDGTGNDLVAAAAATMDHDSPSCSPLSTPSSSSSAYVDGTSSMPPFIDDGDPGLMGTSSSSSSSSTSSSSSSALKKRKRPPAGIVAVPSRHHLRTTAINLGTAGPDHYLPALPIVHHDEDALQDGQNERDGGDDGGKEEEKEKEGSPVTAAGVVVSGYVGQLPSGVLAQSRAEEEAEAVEATRIAQLPYAALAFGPVLGAGFFGQVYRGTLGEREVAIKKMVRRSFRNSSETRLFINETSVFCGLDHPNILKFIGASVSPSGEHCIVSEYMAGGSLRRLLDASPHLLTETKKRKIARDVATGMDYLHRHKPKIIHRDLSSSNILLDSDYTVAKVSDFGLSRFMDDTGGKMTCAVGALAWMAPEVYMGRSYSEKADVYSYAICLAELMTAGDPYQGMEPHLYASYAITNSLRPQLPESLDEKWKEIIIACWHQDPELRPEFADVVAYLDTYLPVAGEGEPLTTASTSTPHDTPPAGSPEKRPHADETCTSGADLQST